MIKHLEKDKKDLKSMIILFKTYNALTDYIKEDIKDTKFDLNEFAVFEVIYHKEELTVKEIKDKVLVANSSLTYILDKLEDKRLIIRKQGDKDKRKRMISLTDKGVSVGLSIFPNHYENLKKVFTILTDDEKETLNSLLKKIGYNALKEIS